LINHGLGVFSIEPSEVLQILAVRVEIFDLSNAHTVKFKEVSGEGSNNYAELIALRFLLKCSLDKKLNRLKSMEILTWS